MGKIERLNIASVQELYNLVADRSVKGFFGDITCTGTDSSGDTSTCTFYDGYISRNDQYVVHIQGANSTCTTFLSLDRRDSDHTASGYIYIYIQLDSGKERCCYALDESNISQSVGHKQRVSCQYRQHDRNRGISVSALCKNLASIRRLGLRLYRRHRGNYNLACSNFSGFKLCSGTLTAGVRSARSA